MDVPCGHGYQLRVDKTGVVLYRGCQQFDALPSPVQWERVLQWSFRPYLRFARLVCLNQRGEAIVLVSTKRAGVRNFLVEFKSSPCAPMNGAHRYRDPALRGGVGGVLPVARTKAGALGDTE